MCRIYCDGCKEPINDDDNIIQVRQGFCEHGDYTPESEVAYYHADCYPLNNQPTED